MFYKNDDYTVRTEESGNSKKYYIRFHSQNKTSEVEIDYEIFILYLKEFNKPLERQRNEQRRHFEDADVDFLCTAGKLTLPPTVIDQAIDKNIIESVLTKCTQNQQRRFKLHHIKGYSINEISKMERRNPMAIWKSVVVVEEKIRELFSQGI